MEDSNLSCDVKTGACVPGESSKQAVLTGAVVDKTKKVKLTYYFDALCGWCYGFSPVVSQVKEKYGDKVDIEVVSGGLFLGGRTGKVNKVAPYIKAGAYKTVEQRTGVTFGPAFIADIFGEEKITLNSLPPAIAIAIIKEQFPEKELAFASILIKAVYFDGFNPADMQGYGAYAEKVGFDKDDFNARMLDPKSKALAVKEFEQFQASSFSGMPALVVESDEGEVLLSNGYSSFESVDAQLGAFFEN